MNSGIKRNVYDRSMMGNRSLSRQNPDEAKQEASYNHQSHTKLHNSKKHHSSRVDVIQDDHKHFETQNKRDYMSKTPYNQKSQNYKGSSKDQNIYNQTTHRHSDKENINNNLLKMEEKQHQADYQSHNPKNLFDNFIKTENEEYLSYKHDISKLDYNRNKNQIPEINGLNQDVGYLKDKVEHYKKSQQGQIGSLKKENELLYKENTSYIETLRGYKREVDLLTVENKRANILLENLRAELNHKEAINNKNDVAVAKCKDLQRTIKEYERIDYDINRDHQLEVAKNTELRLQKEKLEEGVILLRNEKGQLEEGVREIREVHSKTMGLYEEEKYDLQSTIHNFAEEIHELKNQLEYYKTKLDIEEHEKSKVFIEKEELVIGFKSIEQELTIIKNDHKSLANVFDSEKRQLEDQILLTRKESEKYRMDLLKKNEGHNVIIREFEQELLGKKLVYEKDILALSQDLDYSKKVRVDIEIEFNNLKKDFKDLHDEFVENNEKLTKSILLNGELEHLKKEIDYQKQTNKQEIESFNLEKIEMKQNIKFLEEELTEAKDLLDETHENFRDKTFTLDKHCCFQEDKLESEITRGAKNEMTVKDFSIDKEILLKEKEVLRRTIADYEIVIKSQRTEIDEYLKLRQKDREEKMENKLDILESLNRAKNTERSKTTEDLIKESETNRINSAIRVEECEKIKAYDDLYAKNVLEDKLNDAEAQVDQLKGEINVLKLSQKYDNRNSNKTYESHHQMNEDLDLLKIAANDYDKVLNKLIEIEKLNQDLIHLNEALSNQLNIYTNN